MNRNPWHCILLAALALTAVGCSSEPPKSSGTAAPAAAQQETAAVHSATLPPGTDQERTTATAEAAGGSPGTYRIEGPDIHFGSVSFILDPSLAPGLYVFEDWIESPGSGTASFTRFAVTGEAYCRSWCVNVYPVSQFMQVFGYFNFPPLGYPAGGAVMQSIQEIPLDFRNGSGTRTLEMHGQMMAYAVNGTFSYIYRGYTADQEYAVYVQIPISAEILPESPDPAMNTNPYAIPIPTLDAGNTNLQESISLFNEQAVGALEQMDPSDFSPSLNTLDALVASIQVDSPED